MIFISIKRKTLGLLILVLVLCLVGLTIYSTVRIAANENKYKSTLEIARMFEDTHFIAYISDTEAQLENQYVEVFDIAKGQVISRTPLTVDVRNEVVNYVKSIKSLYTNVVPFPDKGFVIRVPFNPPMNVKIKLLNDVGIKSLDAVFFIISEKEEPILLVLDNNRKPYFYTLGSNIQPLLDYVKLNPQGQAMDEDEDPETPTDLELDDEDNPEAPTELEIDDATGPVG